MRLTVILCGVNWKGRYWQGKWWTICIGKALESEIRSLWLELLSMQNSPIMQGIQPTASVTVTLHKQWLTLYRDFNAAILSVFHFSCLQSGGEIFIYMLLYTLALCSPSPTKQEKQMHFLQRLVHIWVWKDQSLAAPSSSAWVVEAKDEPDLIPLLYLIILPALLILPAAGRAMEIPRALSQLSFPALPGLPDAQVALHSPCSWQQRGGGTGRAHGRRWRAALTSLGCRRDTWGTQAHCRLRKFCPCFS